MCVCLPLVTCALHVFVHHFPSYFVHICFHSLLLILVTILAPEPEHDDGAGAIADSGDECRFFRVPALAFFSINVRPPRCHFRGCHLGVFLRRLCGFANLRNFTARVHHGVKSATSTPRCDLKSFELLQSEDSVQHPKLNGSIANPKWRAFHDSFSVICEYNTGRLDLQGHTRSSLVLRNSLL